MVSSDSKEAIKRHVTTDELERAVELLLAQVRRSSQAGVARDLLMLASRLSRARTQSQRGLLSAGEVGQERIRVGYAVLELVEQLPDDHHGGVMNPPPSERTAFISYNHADRTVAARLAETLKANGVNVLIDSDSMLPGEPIQPFINRAIRDTDATVCIISSSSLLSAWVGTETLLMLRHESTYEGKRFFAAYVDEIFFDPAFRLKATYIIDEQLAMLDALIAEYHAKKINPNDLNDERARLYELRHGLGEILAKLRGSLLLDIRDAAFAVSSKRLVHAIFHA